MTYDELDRMLKNMSENSYEPIMLEPVILINEEDGVSIMNFIRGKNEDNENNSKI